MGDVQSCVAAFLAASSVYVLYVHIYCSARLLKTNVFNSDRLPSLAYLYIKRVIKAVARRSGRLYTTGRGEVVYSVVSCRLEKPLLRRFCSTAGYGWEYPDTEFRDTPLCFPAFLCGRLLLLVLTHDHFRLSPAGLLCVRQSLKTHQPVDELKKGPFTLQVGVREYRQMEAGVEVDVHLSATSRTGSLVWESIVTLLSPNELRTASMKEADDSEPEDVKQVELRVPRVAGLQAVWSSSDFSPRRLLALPARLFGCNSSCLWMLSVCLAEIEKHRGVEVITAPVSITARFHRPLPVPGRVLIKFWETTDSQEHFPTQGLSFHMQQPGGRVSHMTGLISRC